MSGTGLEETGLTLVGGLSSVGVAILSVLAWRIYKLEKCVERLEHMMSEDRRHMADRIAVLLENDMDTSSRISRVEGRIDAHRGGDIIK